MKKKSFLSVVSLTLVTALAFSGCALKNMNASKAANAGFDRFTDELFVREVSGNTLNLHYTVANPENYGIKEYPITLGNFSLDAMEQSMDAVDDYLAALKDMNYDALSSDRKLTYDCIYEKLKTESAAREVLPYTEILSASTGFQAQLPVLLAEYAFYDKQDVEDYLALLGQVRPYFQQVLLFEQVKAERGLLMSDTALQDIIDQCTALIADTKDHFLISTFAGRLSGLDLSDEEKKDFIARNQKALDTGFFPAYADLIQGLSALKGQGKNPYGLCYLPKGRQYYEFLVAANTGSSFPVEELNTLILGSLAKDVQEFQKELKSISEKADGTQEASGQTKVNPEAYLSDLQEKMKADFPSLFQVSYTLHDIDSSLEQFLSPAFYLTPALDAAQNNVIYLNRSHAYTPLSLYTTLAHEGFPGHMYQNLYTRTLHRDKVRSLFGTTGYAEGWATYGEMLSYGYAEADPRLASLSRLNSLISLGVCAALDIGIHYHYWTPDDAFDFLCTYGFTDRAACNELYQYILEEPANYLNYYGGYLEFTRLRDLAQSSLGDRFDLKDFHEKILNIGEAPFCVVEKYLKKEL